MEEDRKATDAMTTLAGTGDRELWYAEGGERDKDGQPAWRFPIFVDWKQSTADGTRYACLYPAVCPHYAASVQLNALFEIQNRIVRENQWLIRAEFVEVLLKKAPGITPERYYRWGGKEERPISYTKLTLPGFAQPERLRTGWGKDSRLVAAIADDSGLQTSVVKIVLDALNNVAAAYLVREHATMDLGFVKLIALPFRANWKEIVCFKLRKLGLLKMLTEAPGTDSVASDGPGLPEILCSAHNIAMVGERRGKGLSHVNRVDYTVEAIPSKEFEKQVTRIEAGKRSLGHTLYVGYFEKTVERLYDQILEILQAYRKKIGYPFARVCESRASGGLRFIETLGIRARAFGRNLRDIPVHIVPPRRGFSAIAEQSQQELVCEAAPQVPKLPAFSQAAHDMRERNEQRALEKLCDGQGGNGGVSLLDAGQSAVAGQSVLPSAEIERGPSWVEIIGD